MISRAFRLTVSFLALVGLGLANADASAAGSADTGKSGVYIFVRHAEKSAPNGNVPLSEAGKSRAQTLGSMLEFAGVTHVFTSEMIRTQETAAPLARRRGLTPMIAQTSDRAGLVAKLSQLPDGAVALVVSHSDIIPAIIEKLGAKAPSAIAEEQYDRMFIVSRSADGKANVVELRYGSAFAETHP